MTNSTSESSIERWVCSYANSRGWLTYKWVSPGQAGVMDRIFIKGQRTMFVEFKSPKGVLSPIQKAQIRRLKAYGAEVHVISSHEQGKEMIDA